MQFGSQEFETNGSFAGNSGLVQLINLRYPLFELIGNQSVAIYLGIPIALTIFSASAFALTRWRTDSALLPCVSLLQLLELIAIYHRGYDAIVLAFPIAWSLAARTPRSRAWPIWVGATLFMLPSGVAVNELGRTTWFPHWISSAVLWNAFVVPYQAWTLLAMSLWMTWCVLNQPARADSRFVDLPTESQPAEI